MKPENFLLLVLIAVLFWPNNTTPILPVDSSTVMAAEGMVAIQVAHQFETQSDQPDDPIKPDDHTKSCECKGRGYTLTGDGIHKIPCPKDCKCGCTPKEVVRNIKAGVDLDIEKQVIMFTAKWCGPCQSFKSVSVPILQGFNWKISSEEQAQIRLIDVDENKEAYAQFGKGRALPCFILLEKGVETDHIIGNVSAGHICQLFNKTKSMLPEKKTTTYNTPQVYQQYSNCANGRCR